MKPTYKKKEHTIHQLYLTHVQAVNEWGHIWNTIEYSIHHSFHRISEQKYRHINEKLEKLHSATLHRETPQIQFHSRVVNLTDITFTTDELTVLEKGMQYNLHHKPKHWIRNLAWEPESAISQLPEHQQDYTRYRVARAILDVLCLTVYTC
jgi:hypothetical protein